MARQGRFRPKNPHKYKGNASNIVWRSSWELKLMFYLDLHPQIISWSSEEIAIPYVSPFDGKVHRYFPDFIVKKQLKNGSIKTLMIEVKPSVQTRLPIKKSEKMTKKQCRRFLRETIVYSINSAKWAAAKNYCEQNDIEFIIMTENELGIK